jgi:hypothetical protein
LLGERDDLSNEPYNDSKTAARSVVLIQQTAERGARLVYEYGTGIIGR